MDDCCALACGSFLFHEGKQSAAEDRSRMNITQRLLESARIHDEQQRTG